MQKKILICDDDANYLGLIREWLKDSYKVFAMTNGNQVKRWLGKNKADLILLDIEMPELSGPQVYELIRADEENKDIPVMFLTGKDELLEKLKIFFNEDDKN